MGLTTFERTIMQTLKMETKNRKLTGKNLMEWSTGEIKPHEGEKLIHLKSLGVHVAYTEP